MTTPDTPWTDLGPIENFPDSVHTCIAVKDEPVLVINAGGTLYAIENRCPHAGRPLDEGERAGLILTCPYHGYTYNIKTGKNIDAPDEESPVRTYPVRIEAGRVSIRLAQSDKDNV